MELPYRGSGKVYIEGKEYRCDLYYHEKKAGIILKLTVKNEKTLGSFLQVPLELTHLCGQLDNGFQFTLLHLKRTNMEDLISYGITVFTFVADYVLSGVNKNNECEQTFRKVKFTLSDIIGWGEESVYGLGEKYEIIRKDNYIEKTIYEKHDICIKYYVHESKSPIIEQDLLKDYIALEQYGCIEISLEKEETLFDFIKTFDKLKRLLEIASFRKINVEKISGYSSDVVYTIGEKTIEKPIEIYGKDITGNEKSSSPQNRQCKWISLAELIEVDAFEHYFDKHSTLAPIIELFLEPFYVQYSSETRVFLNIVQALETYHSRFITNDFSEFKERVDDLIKKAPSAKAKELRKMLIAKSKTYITLESRVCDLLLANGDIYFDTGDIKHKDFPSVVAHTRNYHIHYDERIKEKHRVLNYEELQFYNRCLLQVLEYYILVELGFSDVSQIKKKLAKRWGRVSQDLDVLIVSRERFQSQAKKDVVAHT